MKPSFSRQLFLSFMLVLTMTACTSAPNDPLSNEFSSYRLEREDLLNVVYLMEVYPDGSEELTAVAVMERWKVDGYKFDTTYAVSPDDTRVVYTRYNSEEATAEIYLSDLDGLNEMVVRSQAIQLSDEVNQIEDLQWLDANTVSFLNEGEIVEFKVD